MVLAWCTWRRRGGEELEGQRADCPNEINKKRPWRPADLFRMEEVVRLHAILEDTSVSLGDRAMTGHVLHLLYSRSRWSDLCQVTNLFIDSDQRFLELTTREYKGALLYPHERDPINSW